MNSEARSSSSILLLLILAGLGLGTFFRAREWRDLETFWRISVERTPHHARPRLNLAHEYMEQRRYDMAEREFGKILQHLSDVPRETLYSKRARHAAMSNLGLLQVMNGYPESGEALLTRIIDEETDNPYAWVNRGMARIAMGRIPEACSDFRAVGAHSNAC